MKGHFSDWFLYVLAGPFFASEKWGWWAGCVSAPLCWWLLTLWAVLTLHVPVLAARAEGAASSGQELLACRDSITGWGFVGLGLGLRSFRNQAILHVRRVCSPRKVMFCLHFSIQVVKLKNGFPLEPVDVIHNVSRVCQVIF